VPNGWGMVRVSPLQPTRRSGGASWAPPAGSGAEPPPKTDFDVFWRPQNAPFCIYMTKIWGGQFALASPYSKFWEGLVPRVPHDLRPWACEAATIGVSLFLGCPVWWLWACVWLYVEARRMVVFTSARWLAVARLLNQTSTCSVSTRSLSIISKHSFAVIFSERVVCVRLKGSVALHEYSAHKIENWQTFSLVIAMNAINCRNSANGTMLHANNCIIWVLSLT